MATETQKQDDEQALRREASELPALLPCPFCGRQLMNVVIDPEAGWAEHPFGTTCYFDGYEFDMFDPKKWNERAR